MTKPLDDIGEDERLAICSFRECARIRVDDEEDTWISRGDNLELYDRYIKVYEGVNSHSYCPGCEKKVDEEISAFESRQ